MDCSAHRVVVVSKSNRVASTVGWLVNNELERIWKEPVVAYFDVVSRNLPGGTRENCENSRLSVSGPRFESRVSDFEARVLLSRLSWEVWTVGYHEIRWCTVYLLLPHCTFEWLLSRFFDCALFCFVILLVQYRLRTAVFHDLTLHCLYAHQILRSRCIKRPSPELPIHLLRGSLWEWTLPDFLRSRIRMTAIKWEDRKLSCIESDQTMIRLQVRYILCWGTRIVYCIAKLMRNYSTLCMIC
jgi:hypothetical protein